MKTENLDFLTTVERLATEVGLKPPPISFGNNTFHKSESYLNVLKIQEEKETGVCDISSAENFLKLL